MKRPLLLSGAAILLLGITQNFDGQGKFQDRRQMPNEGNTDMARQSKMAQAPFFSRQEPHRWTTDRTRPDRHRMTKPWDHRNDRANAMRSRKTLSQHELSAGIDTAWVRHYSSQVFGGEDRAAAMAIDDSGNVYVTGASEGSDVGSDFATIKYNASGVMQWVARYNGPENSYDWSNALAVDASGNVYVTGSSMGSGPYWDFATVKYNSAGVQQWVARYNGPGNADDGANSLTVDASANVYVVGRSVGSGAGYDYATVKYNSVGVQQWVARYNGPGNADDWTNSMTVDASGNVYVTGRSMGSGTESDYATVKYNSAGVQRWVARYNGPDNSGDGASALAVDASGYIYVTGSSGGSGTESDYATVKYNSDGVAQWVARYNGPGNAGDQAEAVAVDGSGNVYVTGTSQSSNTADDFATIKYNSVGALLWVVRYNGPRNLHDHASALAVDGVGNVYVTGWSASPDTENESDFATVKYNSTGVVQWVARYDGRDNSRHQWNNSDYAVAAAVDHAGNVYVAGTVGDSFRGDGPVLSADYATIKYDASGEAQWTAFYSGPKIDYNYATALAIDKFGSIYVSGYSTNGSDADYVIIKYDASGAIQWIDRCREGYQGTKLVVDGEGSAYVTGFGDRGGYLTVKYNVAGARQWVAHFDKTVVGESHWPGFPWHISLAVDRSGNVYVAGGLEITNDNSDYVTIKYDSSGNEQWAIAYDGPGHLFDNANAIAVDDSGNAYVTGMSCGAGTLADHATIKYNTLGEMQWVQRYNGSANSWDEGVDIVVDDSGNIYATGRTRSSATGEDFITIKYGAAGATQWIASYNGTHGSGWDEATALTLDDAGNVYVTGLSNGYGDFATVKYNNSGEQQWGARYSNSAGQSYDFPYGLAVDASGNVYVTGFSIGLGDNSYFNTIKYNAAGVEQWIAQYNGPGETSDEAWGVAVDAAGYVYVAGTSRGNDWYGSVMTTIKYTENGTVAIHEANAQPQNFGLAQNYPNPFNPSTTIEFALPKSSFVTLKIYDLLGHEVATLVAEKLPAGKHQRVWEASGLASGVYLYRLQAGELVQTKKLILLR